MTCQVGLSRFRSLIGLTEESKAQGPRVDFERSLEESPLSSTRTDTVERFTSTTVVGRYTGSTMRPSSLKTVAAVLLVILMPATLLALDPPQDKGKPDKAKHEKKVDHKDSGNSLDVIAVASAGIQLRYGDARRWATESNLTGYKPLPPGIRKNLARGKPMPPGIAKTRMPSSFLGKLPAHDGYEWHIAGTDLALVFRGDMTISGVLKDVFK